MTREERKRRLMTFESNYGRELGWYVDRDGQRMALLTEPRQEDMFWYSYRVEPLAAAPEQQEFVFSAPFWEPLGLTFRNRVTDEIAPAAFTAGDTVKSPPTRENPRVLVRGLHSALTPTTLESAWLQLRRFRRLLRSKGP